MSWVVLKFVKIEEIEALPSNWYDEVSETCLYPPFPRLQLERAIKSRQEPESNWVTYKVKLMSSKRYESFLNATAKASKACITSDISDVEVLPAKRVPKKKIFSSSDESGNSDSEKSLGDLPRVPQNMMKGFGGTIQRKPISQNVTKESGIIRDFNNLDHSKSVEMQTVIDGDKPADAVQLCDKNVTKKEIELKTGQWLAKAKERLKSNKAHEDQPNVQNDEEYDDTGHQTD